MQSKSDTNDPLIAQPKVPGQQSVWEKLGRALCRRWKWGVVSAVIGMSLGLLIGHNVLHNTYRSTGMIRLEPAADRVLYRFERNETMPMFNAYLDAQVRMVGSERVLELAAQSPIWDRLEPEVATRGRARIGGGVRVIRGRGSQMIMIAFESDHPEAAQTGVEAVIDAYRMLYDESDAAEVNNVLASLTDRRVELRAQLRSLRNMRSASSEGIDPDLLERRYEQKAREWSDLTAALRQVQLQLAAERIVQSNLSEDPSAAADALIAENPELSNLSRALESARVHEQNMRVKFMDDHYQVRTAADQVRGLEELLKQRQAEAATAANDPEAQEGAVDRGLAALEAEATNLRELADSAEASLADLASRRQLIQDYQTQIAAVEDDLRATEDRITTITVESQASGRLEIVSQGRVPFAPVNGNRRAQARILGAVGGIAFGVVLIGGLGLLDRRLHSIRQAQEAAHGLKLLGSLPNLSETPADGDQGLRAAMGVHEARIQLQTMMAAHSEKVIAVTSPNPGSGKTSTCSALGVSFALANNRTLIIDLDLVGRALSTTYAHHNREHPSLGLLDVFRGRKITDCVSPMPIPGLDLLPARAAHVRDVSTLCHSTVRRLIDDAREHYDIVIIDTGPIGASLEASLVAPEADRVALVVSRGDDEKAVRAAHNRLKDLGADIAGLIYNRAGADDMAQSTSSSFSRFGPRAGTFSADGEAVGGTYGPLARETAASGHAPAPK
ncbi:MAG: AAA family ATPase [Planctomycetota bacterium]